MKKPIKRALWGLVTVITLLVILIVMYGIKATSEMKKMSPAETGEITDSIFTIKDAFVNMYLVKTGNRYIAIDAGNSTNGIKEGLDKLKICPDSIMGIFLTHTDGDHTKALSLFPKASIYISKQEEKIINGEKSRFIFFSNSLFGRPYITLEDNQALNILNLKIQGILVPGHTIGSMCYLIDEKYLFTGDALGLNGDKISRFSQLFNMDSEIAAKSMEKLVDFPNAQYIFTAHHGYSSDYKTAVSDWGK